MNATILQNQIPVIPTERDGDKWLIIQVPNGWNDVKQLTKKVLEYNGEKYIWTGWNSDTNQAYFKQSNACALIKSK